MDIAEEELGKRVDRVFNNCQEEKKNFDYFTGLLVA